MAVDTTHLNLFPSQLIQTGNNFVVNNVVNNNQTLCYSGIPMNYNNVYQTAVVAKTSMNTDSGLTYNIPSDSRKRSRDFTYANNNFHVSPQKNVTNSNNQLPSFVGEDLLPQIQRHQLEIDAIISQHTKKMRLELEERQKQQTRILASTIGEGVMKKLKEKDEQIQRMSKMNFVLQERVKGLFLENQLWRDVAQSNEATANSLRSNLEQVMAHVGVGGEERGCDEEEAESCCGSSDHGKEEKEICSSKSDKLCKRCGENESTVLLLPCRHLCLCNGCGSGSQKVKTCPVCNSVMNATLHVNMS